MPTTPLGIPYFLTLSDPPDGGSQSQAQAQAVDGLLQTAFDYLTNPFGPTIPSDAAWHILTGWSATESRGMGGYSGGVRTIASAGVYMIAGQITFDNVASPTGIRGLRLYVNSNSRHEVLVRPDANYQVALPFAHAELFAAGDTVHLEAYNSQGSNQTVNVDPARTHWSMVQVSR